MPVQRTRVMRTKSGCATCRRRHRKCDEAKPVCKNCIRLNISCGGYAQPLVFRDDTKAVRQRSKVIEAQRWAAIHARDEQDRARRRQRAADGDGPEHGLDLGDTSCALSPIASDYQELRERQHGQQSETLETPVPSELPSPLASEAAANASLHEPQTSIYAPSPVGISHQGEASSPTAHHFSGPSSSLSSRRTETQLSHNYGASIDAVSTSSTSPHHSIDGAAMASTPPAAVSPWDMTANTADDISLQSSILGETWLQQDFPTQLPPVLQEIYQEYGYANLGLRSALLALPPLTTQITESERRERLEYYSLALNNMINGSEPLATAPQAIVKMAIFYVLVSIEMSCGTHQGGLAHFRQADVLISSHADLLTSLDTGQRLLGSWVSLKSTYSSLALPWDEDAYPSPGEISQSLLPLLPICARRSLQLLPLLLEGDRLNQRVVLGRLIGLGASWPSFRKWSDKLKTLGLKPPQQSIHRVGVDEDRLSTLAGDLNAWHDGIDMAHLPTFGVTADITRSLDSSNMLSPTDNPNGSASPPKNPLATYLSERIKFRSHQAAIDYLRYAAAQALCSVVALDELTGGSLQADAHQDKWIKLIFRILVSIDPDICSHQDIQELGIMWILWRLVLHRALNAEVLDAVEALLPLIDRMSARLGVLYPPKLFRTWIRLHRDELARGRAILLTFIDFGPREEVWTLRSPAIKYKVLLVGRLIEAGSSFFDVVDVVCR